MFPFCNFRKCLYLCTAILRKQNAQMAESVDALVSNTSGATHPGSTPGLGTKSEFSEENSIFLCHPLCKIKNVVYLQMDSTFIGSNEE